MKPAIWYLWESWYCGCEEGPVSAVTGWGDSPMAAYADWQRIVASL